ncbi:MAG: dTDP-glucose 4,6-dehydratase [Candidatus Omnitrophica bacterium]|nr:dTDP-glucose 4,6-dehydratase [Candidatus Omnitrophota bacterium]
MSPRAKRTILVTGGAGFIGSCLIKLWLRTDPDVSIINYDKLTYCGDLSRLKELRAERRYRFVRGDVADAAAVERIVRGCDGIVHVAAETHVDRSLLEGRAFFEANTIGTYNLIEAARRSGVRRMLLVSTDEVYGSRDKGSFTERDPLNPTSPYSISKAAADLLATRYAGSIGVDCVVTRGSNTYGPYQYPEKVIPLFVSNALHDRPLPLYGDGRQVRNWIHVEDHCRGILTAYRKGKAGEVYNVSSPDSLRNIDLTRRILRILGKPETLVRRVTDRIGHDRRYAIRPDKLRALGWRTRRAFPEGLRETVLWYRDHEAWWRRIKEKSEEFKRYYARAYAGRLMKAAQGGR